mgnify:CR=1 FL=1
MKKLPIYLIIALLSIVFIIIGIAIFLSIDEYVATVSNEKITVSEYNFFLNNWKKEKEKELAQKGIDIENIWEKTADGVNFSEKAKENALKEAKKFEILLIKAKENEIFLESNELKELKTDVENKIDTGDYDQYKKLGINEDEYFKINKNLKIIDKFKRIFSIKENQIDEWVKDSKYNINLNEEVYKSIQVTSE